MEFALHINRLVYSRRIHIDDIYTVVDSSHGLEIPRQTLTRRFLRLEVESQSVDAGRWV